MGDDEDIRWKDGEERKEVTRKQSVSVQRDGRSNGAAYSGKAASTFPALR